MPEWFAAPVMIYVVGAVSVAGVSLVGYFTSTTAVDRRSTARWFFGGLVWPLTLVGALLYNLAKMAVDATRKVP